MTDRERLEKLYEKATEEYAKTNKALFRKTFICDYLLANGVIVPPCNVGETLYQIVDMSHTACKSFVSDFPIRVLPYQIYHLNIMGGISGIPFENFGETVFLTKEEAEAELRKRSENNV